jgi:hypothetical protein
MFEPIVFVVVQMDINELVQLCVALNITYERFFILLLSTLSSKAISENIWTLLKYLLPRREQHWSKILS